MRMSSVAALAAFTALTAIDPSWAASLQVAPVKVEVASPGAATTVKLRNEGTTSLNAQIRVFRWSQVNGEDKLEPTTDVVASPPLTKLSPKTDYTVRLVRVSKTPVAKEETYRLFIDELPDAANQRNRAVNLLLRYSIPVFFYPASGAPAQRLACRTVIWAAGVAASPLAAALASADGSEVDRAGRVTATVTSSRSTSRSSFPPTPAGAISCSPARERCLRSWAGP